MELLDSRQLRAFQELARQGSFTVAAKNLNLTQSAVSHSIKALENALGVSLFERLGKSVHLTPAGDTLLAHADRILTSMRMAQDEIAVLNMPGHGRLRIGSTVTLSQYVLPSVIRELRESFPAFEISVTTEDTRTLNDKLESGEIDLMLGLENRLSNRFQFDRLFEDHIMMAMAPIHPFAAREEIPLDDLASQSFIFYNSNSETFRLVDRYFSENQIRLSSPLHMGSMAAIKEMAKIGMGIGLIAPWVAEVELRAGTLVFRELPAKRLSRSWGIYSDPQRESRFVEYVFAGICRSVLKTLQERTDSFLRARPGLSNEEAAAKLTGS